MGDLRQTPNPSAGSFQFTAQNDCQFVLFVSAYTLTSGQWQSEPQPGQETDPGQTGSWQAVSAWPLDIQGSITQIVAQTGTLTVTWVLNPLSFTPTLTKTNWTRPDIDAKLVTNLGVGNNVWLQLLIAAVIEARPNESLQALALRTRTPVSVLAKANGLTEDAVLFAGQQLLVATHWPDLSLWQSQSSPFTEEDSNESS
jgi:hypothetical protein